MSDTRENFFFMFLGHNRTGKSVTAKQVADEWRQAHDGKIYAHDPQNRFSDILDVKLLPSDTVFREFLDDEPRRCLLILDDYRMLHPNDRMDKSLLDIMNVRNEFCVDIIMIAHAPSLVLERLTYYITHYFLYYTQSTDKGFKEKIPNYKALTELSRSVTNYVKMHGKGVYPTFPYIVFNNETEDATPINFTL